MATFSVLATPIGNLKDITLRALETLKSADYLICEDTRVTKKLLAAHDILFKDKTFVSYHSHNKIQRTDGIIKSLQEGKSAVLVSDAGTPGISDPGAELVARIRKECTAELKSGELKIEAIPGPSALTAALSIAGVPCAEFVFYGFVPHKKGRETLFKEVMDSEHTGVFYESPHRILKTLESLVKYSRDLTSEVEPRTVTICRELTKIFEEVVSGSADEALSHFISHPDKVRGEFVVIVSRTK